MLYIDKMAGEEYSYRSGSTGVRWNAPGTLLRHEFDA